MSGLPSEWRLYRWPSWVSTDVRVKIVTRWGVSTDGAPQAWDADAQTHGVPALGDVVALPKTETGEVVTGRYVHLERRTGFVVDAAGAMHKVRVPFDWRGPEQDGDVAAALFC